ncbi:MAG: EF-hand domain-containing protein [Rhodospirillaceae bacterium]|nr:EF-hand domain-containing protein [Rhodospirillaceae bacterium]
MPVLSAAQDDEDSPAVIAAHWFDRSDLDKDGAVTLEELQSGRAKRFRRMDGDGDGRLTLDEFRYGLPPEETTDMELMARQFALMDADGDGVVTADEYAAYAQTLITQGDTDGDGRLSLDEYTAVFVGR